MKSGFMNITAKPDTGPADALQQLANNPFIGTKIAEPFRFVYGFAEAGSTIGGISHGI